MSRFLFIIQFLTAVCCLWCACTAGDRETEKRLFASMDSLLEANPDSAYKVLTDMQKEVDLIDEEAVSMRYMMFLAEAENKLFLPMPSDSSFMDVVSWYDLHGSANDRMRARYLLGCIYRDLKEAPQAVRYYQEAAECADTASIDCDYATLLHIYSQMGVIYYYQYFPEKTLECYQMQSYYARKAGDIYNCIRGIELQTDPYDLMADTAKVIEITDSAYHLYMSNNMPENAARVFPHVIYIHFNRGEYFKARKLMDIFERESGLFDSEGNIMNKGYGRYDYARGLYSLWQGETEQAKRYFLRLFENGFEYEAYDGFARIYRHQSNPDSVYKYVELSDKVLTAQLDAMQIQAVTLSSSLYDYNRIQRLSDKSLLQAEKTKRWLWITGLSGLLFIAVLLHRYLWKRKEIIRVKTDYSEISSRYVKIRTERESLMQSYSELKKDNGTKDIYLDGLRSIIKNKDCEIEYLKEKLDAMRKVYSGYLSHQNLEVFLKCDSVKEVLAKTIPYPVETAETDHLWDQLLTDFRKYLPNLYFVLSKHDLSRQRMIISVLIVLKLTPKQISLFIGSSQQSISKQESSINEIVFNEATSRTLKKNLLSLCYEDTLV